MGFDTDESVVAELKLFTENDADIYRQSTTPIIRNLMTKRARGLYDHDKAVKIFMYLAEAGARKYAREHGGGEHEWSKIFPANVRRKAAEEWRDEFETEADLGNYDNATFLPKKYLPSKSGKPKPAAHSKAFMNGRRDGQAWANNDPGASRVALVSFLASTTPPHKAAIAARKPGTVLYKLFDLEHLKKIGDEDFIKAFSEYDDGFRRGATAVFDAMEGN